MIKIEYGGIKIECETTEQAAELLKAIASVPRQEVIPVYQPYRVPGTVPYDPWQPTYPFWWLATTTDAPLGQTVC